MYKLFLIVSILVRQFLLPNPFEALGEGLTITISGGSFLLIPDILNLIAEPILYGITYAVVGLYYDRGSNAALGSFLYLMFYCIHTFLLWLMSLAGFAVWAVVLVLVGYILCHVGFAVLRERVERGVR